MYRGNVQNTQVNVSELSENHHLYKKQCAMCTLLVCVYYSVLPAQERTLCPIRPKPRLLPPISCFSPAPAASNYPIPPAGPPLVVLRLVPVSKTTRRVTWAWGGRLRQLGARILHQFSLLLVFSSLQSLVPNSWPGFWSLVFQSLKWDGCIHPPNFSPHLLYLQPF